MKNFKKELTTVWSFPERGKWLTHNPSYRGNFAPQIARNAILKYSEEDEIVLDPMVGGGTSIIEAKSLNRKAIGYDINPKAVKLTKNNLDFEGDYKYKPVVRVGDIRKLDNLKDKSIDFVITHPPYLNIIKYSKGKIKEDLSNISGVKKFCREFEKGIKELYRVLKPDSHCAILIGDTRRSRHYIPLSTYVMERFLNQGFLLKDDIIKVQHNCKSTPKWKNIVEKYNFHMIMHEHLYIFRKPKENENIKKYRYSMKKNKDTSILD